MKIKITNYSAQLRGRLQFKEIPVVHVTSHCTFASQEIKRGAYCSQTSTSFSGSEQNYIHNQEIE